MKKIAIKGAIVANEDKWIYDWVGLDSTSPNEVAAALDEATAAGESKITVEISSPGGDVIAANEIYYALQHHQVAASANITADITGWAASAASYIALAAAKVRILPTAIYMIHNVWGNSTGDYRAMDKSSAILQSYNKAIANAYRLKTGMSEAELLKLMDKETWLTAQEAKEKGFVDEIIGDEEETLSTSPEAVYNTFAGLIPKAKIEELRKLRLSGKIPENTTVDANTGNTIHTVQIKKQLIF